ncbi:MAG: hypothetical protein ABSF67_07460 [Roseiarcus sp.]
MHAKGSVNWINVLTIVSVAVLVGTELIGAAGAAGWAIGGLFQLGDLITHILEVALILLAVFGLTRFLHAVLGHEQLRY